MSKSKVSLPENEELVDSFIIFAFSKGKDSHIYYRLPSLDINTNDGDTNVTNAFLHRCAYPQRLFKAGGVGSIYKCKFTKDGETISFSKSTLPTAFWQNSEDRTQWQTLHSAYSTEAKTLSETKVNMLVKTLRPVAEAYDEADYIARRLILAEAIRIITSGR